MENTFLDPDLTELETVEIGWWPTPTEAELRSRQLWASGIPSILTSAAGTTSMLPSFENRVGVFVRQRDFVAAMAVLTDRPESEIEENLLAAREAEMAKNAQNRRFFNLFLKALALLLALFAMIAAGQFFLKT